MWGRVQRHLSSGYATTLQVGVFKSGRVLRGGRKQFYFRFRKQKKNNASASKWFPRESHRILGLASSGALGILAIFRTFRPNCRFYVVPFVFTTQSNKTLAKPIQKANFFRWKALWKQQKKTVKLGKPASKCWMIIVFSLTKLRNCLMKL